MSLTACEAQIRSGGEVAPIVYALGDPIVAIGGLDERPEYQLHRVVSAVRLLDGRIVIADAGPNELRYYDPAGRFLRSVGRSGKGPAEFRNLRTIARIRGDSVVAWDPGMRRVSIFDSKGNFVTAKLLTGWPAVRQRLQSQIPGSAIAAYALHVSENGGMAVQPFVTRSPAMMAATRVIQDTVPLIAFDANGEQTRALGPFPGNEAFLHKRTGVLLRFGEQLEVAAGKEFLYVGSTRDPQIRAISFTGKVVRSIMLPIKRRPITRADLRTPESWTGPAAELWTIMPAPDSMPLFSEVRHGVDGRLWVQKYRAPNDRSHEWLSFDERGRLVASLRMDASKNLLDVGRDYVIVLATDNLDVHEVQLYRLRRHR